MERVCRYIGKLSVGLLHAILVMLIFTVNAMRLESELLNGMHLHVLSDDRNGNTLFYSIGLQMWLCLEP